MNNIAVNIGDQLLGPGHFLTSLGGVGKLVTALSSDAMIIAGVILIFIIIIAGISMISASGDAQQYAKAQTMLTTGITGFVLVVAAWFIIKIIELVTGVHILTT